MATYPKVLKPARSFPNVNAVHAIRASINQVNPNPSLGQFALVKDKGFHIGTIPRGSIILPSSVLVITAFTATATVKVGSATVPESVITTALVAPGTTGYKANLAVQALGLAVIAEDTPVFVLAEVIAPIAGQMEIIIPFYTARD
jgi:hypothetical protein